MTHIINGFLTDNHTDGDGIITINDDVKVMKLTAELIQTDKSTDFDCMVSELLESDEVEAYCKTLILQKLGNLVVDNMACDKLAASILTECIDRLLRAG